MFTAKIDDPETQYVPLLQGKEVQNYMNEKGVWVLANVEQNIGWPEHEMLIVYRKIKITLLPGNEQFCPAVAIKCNSYAELKQAKTFLMYFLSALAWAFNDKIYIVRWSNSAMQAQCNEHLRLKHTGVWGQIKRRNFRPTYLPVPQSEEARLALGLYREGMSLNHEAYSFLSFYKIINLRYRNGDKQKAWIRRNLPALEKKSHLKGRLAEIKQENEDMAEYLYVSCRCAVAHASLNAPTYDPENIDDEIRLYKDKPIIKHLAKIMIETEYGIKAFDRVYQEHLHELAGFKRILGKDLVAELVKKETIPRRSVKMPERICVRLWNHDKFNAFENMKTKVNHAHDGRVELCLFTDNNVIEFTLHLDFPSENLVFDPVKSIKLTDDNSTLAASQIADYFKFFGSLICNGMLEIWLPDGSEILSWCASLIPVNINPAATYQNCIEQEKIWREKSKVNGK